MNLVLNDKNLTKRDKSKTPLIRTVIGESKEIVMTPPSSNGKKPVLYWIMLATILAAFVTVALS